MRNILYIGHYNDNNGLGESCRRYVDCLSSNIKFNLTTRPLYLTNSTITDYINNDRYNEYENNSAKKYDTVIQHTLPDYVEYNKDFGKNIAVVEIETININYAGWADKLNLMDEIWVGSKFAADSLMFSGVYKPIKIIPEPYNLLEYENKKDNFFTYDDHNCPFIFYTIGQYAEKKNIKSIILAYLLEFNKSDNVRLFIKTCDHRKQNDDLENLIKYDMSVIKNILRKSQDDYPDVDIVCGYLSSSDIIRLHQSASCYINAAKGDSFGASAIESAICEKIVINTKNIGSSTYFNNTNALMMDCVESTTICSNSMIKNMYTMYEKWFEPSVTNMQKMMRKAYDMTNDKRQGLSSNFNKNLFSYNNIYELMQK